MFQLPNSKKIQSRIEISARQFLNKFFRPAVIRDYPRPNFLHQMQLTGVND